MLISGAATATRCGTRMPGEFPRWNTSPPVAWTMIPARGTHPGRPAHFRQRGEAAGNRLAEKSGGLHYFPPLKILANGHTEQIRTACQEQRLWIKHYAWTSLKRSADKS